jgi:hypothetical protein
LSEARLGTAPPSVTEWEPQARPPGRTRSRVLVAGLLAVVPAAAAVLGFVAGSVAGWVLAGAAVALEAGWVLAQGRLVRAGARASTEEHDTRVTHMAKGLAADLGLEAPRVYVSDRAGCNVAVIPMGGGGGIVVTEELLDTFERTELEAVIAHCLLRLRAGGLRWALAGAALGLGGVGAPFVGELDDARSAEVTRYPPALASAIEKASPVHGRAAALWLVGAGVSHLSASERIEALLDL